MRLNFKTTSTNVPNPDYHDNPLKIKIINPIHRFRWFYYSGMILILVNLVSCREDPIVPDPYPRSLQVWLYNADNPKKAQYFQNSYNGLELNVHFDTLFRTFIVQHDFNDTSTLTLSTWLSLLDEPRRLGFWLDFKNLAEVNKVAALAELLRIRKLFNLDQHTIIVESTNPSCLPPFNTLNFRISYYIPPFDPATLTEKEELAYRDFIERAISPYGIGTISGYSIQHNFMQKWFPGINKLLWYLDSFDPALKDSVTTEIREDPTVEVLLVAENYPSDLKSKNNQFPFLLRNRVVKQ